VIDRVRGLLRPAPPSLDGRWAWAALSVLVWGGGTRAEPSASAASVNTLQEVVVTAERLKLIGIATTASEGVVVDADLGAWSGGLQYRYLGAYPLSSDGAVRGSGYGEWNGDIRYAFKGGWKLALGVYNITNKKANAVEFWYVDRLPGEPAAGVADVHLHPLEPLSARLTLSENF